MMIKMTIMTLVMMIIMMMMMRMRRRKMVVMMMIRAVVVMKNIPSLAQEQTTYPVATVFPQ